MGFDLSILGVQQNIPRVNFMEYTGLIQAPPKWGKTTIASLYPDCILAAVEQGFKAKKINYFDASTWKKFVDFIDKVEKNRAQIGKSIQSIAIDTVDRLYPECQKYVVDRYNNGFPKPKYKAKAIADIPHGKGWGMADEEFLKQFNRLIEMQFTVLFLTHNKLKTVNPDDGEQYDMYVPTMSSRCADIIFPLVDFIINGERTVDIVNGEKVGRRLIRLEGNSMANAGNRVGDLNATIKFDTEQESLDKFREAFKEGIINNISLSGVGKTLEEIEADQAREREERLSEYLANVKDEEAANPDTLKSLKEQIVTEVKARGARDNKELMELIKSVVPSGNTNTIKDIKIAQKLLDDIKEIK